MPTSTLSPSRSIRILARPADPVWAVCSAIAVALIVVAAFLPLWRLELVAPQYPNGLFITAYGYDMTGDITEVNGLNHYVGLRPLEPDDVVELKLFPFGVAGVAAVIILGAYRFQSRKARALSVLAAASLPVVMLADLQYWLYTYGHDIDPHSALHLDPFTPKVLGNTRVLNFHSVTTVAPGFWLMVTAAALLLAGPPVFRWLRATWKNTGTASAAVVAVLATALVAIGGPVGPGAGYSTAVAGESITEALARALPGDTVRIKGGVHHEQLVIDKPVVLIGEDSPVIDAGQTGDVVVIAAEGVTLRGFVIQGSGRGVSAEPAGIRVMAAGATIEDNVVRDVLYGIVLQETGSHTVRDNHVESVQEFSQERRGNAIYLHNSYDNTIESNTITDAKDGILLLFADRNLIRGNTVTHVRYGIHFMYASDNQMIDNVFSHNVNGGVLMYSNGTVFRNNEFSYNRSLASGYGIMFKDVDDVEISGNLIHHNRIGLALEGAPFTPGAFVKIDGNLVGYNQTAVGLFTTTDVTFRENTFVGNLQQIDAVAGNIGQKNRWSEDGRGNYWDDYQGYDADGDGVGDLPYRYAGAYDALVKKNEALRAYDYTPARMALDLAARWFPVYRPEARAVDAHPLMSPTMKLGRSSDGTSPLVAFAIVTALALVPLGGLMFVAGSARRRWARC
ncbi:MAG: nitrous oxide reductase family maturation protein NosD [Dehalococcoidia bacterium]